MSSGFIVYALPRSRTAWLSRFLSFGDWSCSHEELRHVRSLDDVRSWFAQPHTGTVETAAAPWWRLVPDGVRTVTIRRPVADVMDSLDRLGVSVPRREIERMDAKLDQIEARVRGCLSMQFKDIDSRPGELFAHCLQQPMPNAWWRSWQPIEVQVPIVPMIRYATAYQRQLRRACDEAQHLSMAALRRRKITCLG